MRLIACLAVVLLAAAPAFAAGSGSATLDAVRGRGELRCGVGGSSAGYSLPDSQGVMRGLDADTCRAVAAAVLGDASKVQFVPLTTGNRFTALQSGDIDLLSRTTTWTLGREASNGLEFAWINFYDGTAFLVKKQAGVSSAKGLDGASICIQPGTSTELAVADYFRQNGMKFTPILIDDINAVHQAFLAGRCDAFASDSSQLAGFRSTLGPRQGEVVLLPELISAEPLGPMVRKGDDRWFDIVRWTMIAALTAEQEGITSQNLGSFANSTSPSIRRLLGREGDLGQAMGLADDWAAKVIAQVGNTEEVWNRNLAPLGIPRGRNAPWTKGGLQYPPPIR